MEGFHMGCNSQEQQKEEGSRNLNQYFLLIPYQ